MKEFRVGMVGYGQMGRIHTYAYKTIPIYYNGQPGPIRLVGVCDTDERKAKEGVEQAGYESWTTNLESFVARKDFDIINICVPNNQHAAILRMAMKSGKHIYCEKPLAFDLKEAEALAGEMKATSLTHQITAEYRFLPALMKAKSLIDQGAIGEIFHFRGVYLHAGYIDRQRPLEWRLRKSIIGGGVLVDLGPHLLDIMHFLVGEAAEVCGHTKTFITERPLPEDPKKTGKVDVEDAVIASVKLQNGGMATVEMSRVATGAEDEMRFEVHGSKGALKFNLMEPNWLDYYDAALPKSDQGFRRIATIQKYPPPAAVPAPKFTLGWMRAHVAAQFAFLSAIAEGRPASPGFEEAVKVHRLMDAIYRSVEAQKWVSVTLQPVRR